MRIAFEELYKMRYILLAVSIFGFGVSFCIVGSVVPVLLGNLLGLLTAFTEMLLLGYSTETALEKNANQAVSGMVGGYFLRMALIAVLFYGTTKVDTLDTLSYVLPLFYPRIAIYLFAIKRKKGGE